MTERQNDRMTERQNHTEPQSFHACEALQIGVRPRQRALLSAVAAWQAAAALHSQRTRELRQQASNHSWQPSPRSRLRCYRERAYAPPMHGHLELSRLLRLADRCLASAESFGRHSGRHASCCGAAVATELQNYRTTELQNYRTTELHNDRTTELSRLRSLADWC